MKNLYRLLCSLAITLPLVLLSACVSALYGPMPNMDKMNEDLPPDLSAAEFCDYKIAKCKLPESIIKNKLITLKNNLLTILSQSIIVLK